jgi:hypothetical protein
MDESYTHEELKEKVRTGWQLYPDTPGLKEAAREVILPLIAGMKGQKIIYECRVSWVMRVDELTIDEKGFRAAATRLCRYQHPYADMEAMALICEEREAAVGRKTLEFWGSWSMFHLCGIGIKGAMSPDIFSADQRFVEEVESAAAAGASSEEIYKLINAAWDPHAAREN